LTSEIAASLKNKRRIASRLITVVTDFGVHPFWICPNTDDYIVASSLTKEKLIKEGIPAGHIHDFGIPIDEKFLRKYDRQSLGQKLGIDPAKFTILIMTGSFGIGPLEEIARKLCRVAQVLVVCATNRRLYQKLKKKEGLGIKAYGFVNNPEELMAVSDVIITKPGGASIVEIVAMELVPVFISAIPGQEEENERVLRRFGVGFLPRSVNDIARIISDLKADPQKSEEMRFRMRELKKPNAIGDICDVVRKGSPGACG
jgi:processive 1,2-diacylglycerol beta-glucosyltransferase